MYRFSRAIYRELAGEIIVAEVPCGDIGSHERVLRSCEAAIERLATDRHYFAKPARTLFNDIRIYFPMCSQHRVWNVVERYMAFADEYFQRQPMHGFDINGNPLECRATTRKGTAVPADAAASQRVLPVAPASGRDRRGRGRPRWRRSRSASFSWPLARQGVRPLAAAS